MPCRGIALVKITPQGKDAIKETTCREAAGLSLERFALSRQGKPTFHQFSFITII
jgi:hypothetical protein